MPRQVRIEYGGAFYHVMARGNRRNPIFASPDGSDEELFLRTLAEACERAGFRAWAWAWVLMRNHYGSSQQAKDHALRDAEALIAEAARALDLEATGALDFAKLPQGDPRRAAVAWALARNTTLPQRWIADQLSMRTPGNVSEQARRFARRPARSLQKPVRAWRKRMQENCRMDA